MIWHGPRHGLAAVGVSGTVLLVADAIGRHLAHLVRLIAGALRRERDDPIGARPASGCARAGEERRLRRLQDERLAIAHQVHDVLGHLSVISMRAGVALHVARRPPEQALEALEAIRVTSKAALDEFRTALDILKDRQFFAGPERIGDLVYRVVQEALTNVVRHVDAAMATVMIDYGPTEVIVEVTDDGTGRARARVGNGLAGMRERVSTLRGTLTTGPRAEGGFAVQGRLPRTRDAHSTRAQPPATGGPFAGRTQAPHSEGRRT